MKDEYNNLELVNNEKEHRFEMQAASATAFVNYKQTRNIIQLIHTQVPAALEGKGAGTALVEKTLNYIKNNQLKLISLCAFVTTYINRHPEWKNILEEA